MRTVVLLLLVANLLLWGGFELGGGSAPGGEPERLAQQIAPEKLKIVARGEPPPAPPPPKAAEVAAPPSVPLACASYPGLTEALADAIFPLITRRSPELMVARDRDQIYVKGFRVQLEKQGSRAHAERKARELRELGVNDFTIVGSGSVWVVSLGVFSTEEAAKSRLSALRRQGVRTALTQPITYPDSRERVTASGPADGVARAVEAVREAQPELAVEACAPPSGDALPAETDGTGVAASEGRSAGAR